MQSKHGEGQCSVDTCSTSPAVIVAMTDPLTFCWFARTFRKLVCTQEMIDAA